MSEESVTIQQVDDHTVETLAEVLDDQLTIAVTRGTPTHFIADEATNIARGALETLAQFGWRLVKEGGTEGDSGESREVSLMDQAPAAALAAAQKRRDAEAQS